MTENKKENEKIEELEDQEDEDIQGIDEDEMDQAKGGIDLWVMRSRGKPNKAD